MAGMEGKSLGQIGYETYSQEADGQSLVTGDPLPEWPRLSADIRAAWNRAAEAIVAEAERRVKPWKEAEEAEDASR